MIELPDLQDQVLDEPTVAALFGDLELVEMLEVRVKAAPGARAVAGTLEDARRAWEEGALRGLQVRYRWEGAVWFDTLLRTPGGTRLVRMREPG